MLIWKLMDSILNDLSKLIFVVNDSDQINQRVNCLTENDMHRCRIRWIVFAFRFPKRVTKLRC